MDFRRNFFAYTGSSDLRISLFLLPIRYDKEPIRPILLLEHLYFLYNSAIFLRPRLHFNGYSVAINFKDNIGITSFIQFYFVNILLHILFNGFDHKEMFCTFIITWLQDIILHLAAK